MLSKKSFRSRSAFYLAIVLIATIAFAVAGELPNIPGSSWYTSGKATAKIKGEGSIKGPMWPEIYFGPQGGLGQNQFLVVLDDGQDEVYVTGTYSLKKGKLKNMNANKASFADSFEDIFDKYAGGYIDVDITVQSIKIKSKSKSKNGNESIKFKFSSKFIASALGQHLKCKMGVKSAGGH